jgi:hypothetical protein
LIPLETSLNQPLENSIGENIFAWRPPKDGIVKLNGDVTNNAALKVCIKVISNANGVFLVEFS